MTQTLHPHHPPVGCRGWFGPPKPCRASGGCSCCPCGCTNLHNLCSAPRMTGRRSHWTERGDDNFFFTFDCGALVPSLAANGLIVLGPSCVNSLYPSPEVLGGNDPDRAEKQNVVLTWFRPVTWSSGHLGRRSAHCRCHCAFSRQFSGTSWECPASKFCTIFSDKWHVLKNSASVQPNYWRVKKTPKEIQHKDLFYAPFSPHFKIPCVCAFPAFQREKQPEH